MRSQQRVVQMVALIVIAGCVFAVPVFGDCPELVGSVDTPGNASGAASSWTFAFVADGYTGLRVIDVGTPSTPVEVGFLDTGNYAVDVAVADGYAYVLDGSGLSVIDVSTPWAPVEIGNISTNGGTAVAVSNGYAYVTVRYWFWLGGGLSVIDVSTPSTPVGVGWVETLGHPTDVALAGSYAYVVDGDSLHVIDVSAPSAPVEVGTAYPYAGEPRSVAVSGSYAYVTTDIGLGVIDVSSPSVPLDVAFVERPDSRSVAVSGGYAYLAEDFYPGVWAGLRVFDVSTPSAPVEVGFALTSGWAVNVAVAGAYVYFAVDSAGLAVFLQCDAVRFSDGFESGDTTAWSVTVP